MVRRLSFLPDWGARGREIAGIWLGEGERPANDIENIDLLFKMAGFGSGLIEIVLRSGGMAVYGGYVFGESLSVTDELVAGHRVLVTTIGQEQLRFEYNPNHPERPQYEYAGPPAGATVSAVNVRKVRKHRR